MTTLILILSTDWPDPQREASWLKHDANGRLVDRGHGPPSAWPTQPNRASAAATGDDPPPLMTCTLLLAGTQLSIHPVRLPAGPSGHQPAVMASVLEDRLLEDSERLVYVADTAGEQVAVIRRSRLSALIERLAELGLQVVSAWPLHFALPAQAGAQGLVIGNELDIRLADGQGIALPLDARLSDWLAALGNEGLPQPLPVWHPAANAEDRPALGDQRLHYSDELPLLQPPGGTGFLYGSLAPAVSLAPLRHCWRRPRQLALTLLLMTVLLALADLGRMAYLARKYRQDIADSFQSVLPGSAMLDPIRQLQRAVAPTEGAPSGFYPLARGLLGDPAWLNGMDSLRFATGQLQLLTTARIDDTHLEEHCRPLGLVCTHPPGTSAAATLNEIDISLPRQP